jgi:hypothetical protein
MVLLIDGVIVYNDSALYKYEMAAFGIHMTGSGMYDRNLQDNK